MDYAIWLGLAALIILVIYLKTREGSPSEEELKEEDEILEARANAPINNVTGKEQTPADKVSPDIIKAALRGDPPPPPPMRTGNGGPTRAVPQSRPVPPPVAAYRDERRVSDTPATTQNSGISLTDVVVGALVLDALTPDTTEASPVETPREPEPTPSYVEPETTRYEPPQSTSYGGDSSSSSWSSDDSSSSSSDSSSSSFD